jgi:hypothetical protein
LRAFAIVAAVCFMALLIIDPARTDLSLLALLVGALTLWLGYEGTIRLPDVIGRRRGGLPSEGDETGEEARERRDRADD